ncbi:hypothetical protein KIMH_14960 [Bombiscardovia apis]|uniref:Uncharacterized protein n=1 Tax=Bombiscardovia apis TaxID=2932182 RepID=A0ABM8BES1_9BIFI|nr:SpaA isopeptide-forming pilin-related protein [Bombiscardovia apis]BDR55385.1 hypothetical protein KIMH_14960 [Bombiscardovia apis]
MRIHNENAGSVNLAKRVLGLSVAVLTSAAAFLVAAPGAQATPTFDTDDQFSTTLGAHAAKLDVTKYLQNAAGASATGTIGDKKPGTPVGVHVAFRLRQVEATAGHQPSDMDATASSPTTGNYQFVSGGVDVYGVTDANGKIVNGTAGTDNGKLGIWQTTPAASVVGGLGADAAKWKEQATAAGSNPADVAVADFGTDLKYWILEEVASPYTDAGYSSAEKSIFSMPFLTTGDNGGTVETGYIHHLHIFPKNVLDQQLTKEAVKINGNNFDPAENIAVVGDEVTWEVTNALETGTPVPNDNKLYLDDIKNTASYASANYLIMADRLGSALTTTTANVGVEFRYEDANGATISTPVGTEATIAGPNGTNPKALDGTTDMFTSNITPDDSTYVSAAFKHDTTNTALVNAMNAASMSNPRFVMTIKSTVTANGDSQGNQGGFLTNTAASDNANCSSHTNPPHAGGQVPSAGYQFAKVTTDGHVVQGAKFMLEDPANADKFLADDGTFAAVNDGKTLMTATSNANGLVTFIGLPVRLDARTGANLGKYRLREVQAPAGYQQPVAGFNGVDFSDIADTNTVTDAQVIAMYPTGIHPVATPNFGAYKPSAIDATIVDASGTPISIDNALANFADGQNAPISLPLTGGKGILLLLVVGLAIMGGVLVVRNRKSSSVARNI